MGCEVFFAGSRVIINLPTHQDLIGKEIWLDSSSLGI